MISNKLTVISSRVNYFKATRMIQNKKKSTAVLQTFDASPSLLVSIWFLTVYTYDVVVLPSVFYML